MTRRAEKLNLYKVQKTYENRKENKNLVLLTGFEGNVQNTNFNDLVALPEGLRERESKKVRTKQEIKPKQVIERLLTGVKYKVQTVQDYHIDDPRGYYKAILVRID